MTHDGPPDVRPAWPWRMLMRGRFTPAWIAASDELRAELFELWIAHHRRWQEQGCRLIVSMDDLGTVGEPGPGGWNFYAVWEIPDPSLVYTLLQAFWNEAGDDALSLSVYFAVELVLGKPILSMERELGGPLQATHAP